MINRFNVTAVIVYKSFNLNAYIFEHSYTNGRQTEGGFQHICARTRKTAHLGLELTQSRTSLGNCLCTNVGCSIISHSRRSFSSVCYVAFLLDYAKDLVL